MIIYTLSAVCRYTAARQRAVLTRPDAILAQDSVLTVSRVPVPRVPCRLSAVGQGITVGLVVGLALALTASFGASFGGAPPPEMLPTEVDGCGFNVTLAEDVSAANITTSGAEKSVVMLDRPSSWYWTVCRELFRRWSKVIEIRGSVVGVVGAANYVLIRTRLLDDRFVSHRFSSFTWLLTILFYAWKYPENVCHMIWNVIWKPLE